MDWKFTDKAFLAIVMTPRAVLPIKAALADRKKLLKLDPFSWAGAWAGEVQGALLEEHGQGQCRSKF